MESSRSRTFNCDWCGKSFASERFLARHQTNICPRRATHSTVGRAGKPVAVVHPDSTTSSETAGPSSDASHGINSEQSSSQGAEQLRKMLMSKCPSLLSNGRSPFFCEGCKYTPNCGFTQHVMQIHTGALVPDIPSVLTPHPGYCERCDINFRSFEAFQIHKREVCHTRPVYEFTEANFFSYERNLEEYQRRKPRRTETQHEIRLGAADSTIRSVQTMPEFLQQSTAQASPGVSILNTASVQDSTSAIMTPASNLAVSFNPLTSSSQVNVDSITTTISKVPVSRDTNSVSQEPRTKCGAQIIFLSSQKGK